MGTTGLGVTIGSYSLRAVKLKRKGDGFVIQRVFADRLNDDTRRVAGRALAARGIKGTPATLGLTGRDVIIRYSQVPPVPDWRLRNLMKFEVDEVGSQSGGDVSADYRKLELPDPEGTRDEDTILVALARNTYLDRQIKALSAGGLGVAGGCPNSVALFNAFAVNATYTEDETTLLVNIGAEDIDIAIQQGGELVFARNAMPGGTSFTEAIQQAFSTTAGKAEQMKLAKADVTPRGQARYPDATAEKVANAIMGVAGQLASMVQSTLMIARAQAKVPDLKVDRVAIAGGGASLKGLDLYLKQAMGVPVERFDPFAISDLSGLPEDERAMAEKAPHEFAVAVGLAQAYVAPASFELVVLPTSLKARRDFFQKGIWAAAAGLVAAGILGALYVGRTSAVEEASAVTAKVSRAQDQVKRSDDKFRKALAQGQELAIKHRVLADMAAPGALLGQVIDVLETNLADTKEVYLQNVQLKVDESGNEFDYYLAKAPKSGSGYTRTRRRRYFRRDPQVLVSGRISGAQRPDATFQEFVQRCQANPYGLLVSTRKSVRRGRGDRDATFEVEFLPGVQIQLTAEDGSETTSITLRDLSLDDLEDPMELRGRRGDGVLVSLPLERVERRQRKDLVKELKATLAAGASDTDANEGDR